MESDTEDTCSEQEGDSDFEEKIMGYEAEVDNLEGSLAVYEELKRNAIDLDFGSVSFRVCSHVEEQQKSNRRFAASSKNAQCCARRTLAMEPDFLNQKSRLQEEIEARGHQVRLFMILEP